MVFITFALVSLLIVIPIIYFIPIDIPVKWKITVVGISFIIANTGLLTRMQFELWQSLLILFLLVALSSFLISKRIGEPSNLSIEKNIQQNKLDRTTSLQKEAIILTKEEQPLGNYEKGLENQSVEEEQYSQPFEAIGDLEKNESFEELEPLKEAEEKLLHTLEEDTFEIDEDISFLLNRDENLNITQSIESDLADKNNETEQEASYMSEIEKLLEETDIEAEENTGYTHIEEVKEMGSLEEIVIQKDNVKTELEKEERIRLDEEVEIEELVFQK